MTPRQLGIVKAWVDEALKSTLDDRELHLDEIDLTFRDPATWIDGGCACFAAAVEQVDLRKCPRRVVLNWSLGTGHEPIGFPFNSRVDIETHFDCQSPWLRLLDIDFVIAPETRVHQISPEKLLGCAVRDARLGYLEHHHPSGEYNRFLWLEWVRAAGGINEVTGGAGQD